MKHRVFIDGRAGTTGLRIEEYLGRRDDIELIDIDEAKRKDIDERLAMIEEADVAFLCLPDEGSREIVAALDGRAAAAGADSAAARARIIDASTAHRTSDGWVYGLPELAPEQRGLIGGANRVAMAGCHATGFILLVRPLVDAGIAPPDYPFAAHSVTGYSGGGKQMIAQYEEVTDALLGAPRQYALAQGHKHLPEMAKLSGISFAPHFSPHVSNYFAGMEVVVPLHRRQLAQGAEAEDVRRALEERYGGEQLVRVAGEGENPEGGFLSAGALAGRNDMEIFVLGNAERILLTARYDNLGKGASGSGVQCMNLMLGLPETDGLL
ncbi:MAG: N-acetyl-gamma-glutamyl-phosphate reductase [Clostridiales Family XIII bacterium]|nr:N-acetyl-gamma-glutamyl-phosphate reductase [Clostridiales Family XIII bacterium]